MSETVNTNGLFWHKHKSIICMINCLSIVYVVLNVFAVCCYPLVLSIKKIICFILYFYSCQKCWNCWIWNLTSGLPVALSKKCLGKGISFLAQFLES